MWKWELSNSVAVMLVVDESGIPRENHRPEASQWQTLSHKILSRHRRESNSDLYKLCNMVQVSESVRRYWWYPLKGDKRKTA
jgi:hypothetical protein